MQDVQAGKKGDMQDDAERAVLNRIEADRNLTVGFLQGIATERTPNPRGYTRAAAAYINRFLGGHCLPHRIASPYPEIPNILGGCEGGQPVWHLVPNCHIDVFPEEPGDPHRVVEPWSGETHDGRVYGRGACEMNTGTGASIVAYACPHAARERLRGTLTLTCVPNEETFVPSAAQYLMDQEPEWLGHCPKKRDITKYLIVRSIGKCSFCLRLREEMAREDWTYSKKQMRAFLHCFFQRHCASEGAP